MTDASRRDQDRAVVQAFMDKMGHENDMDGLLRLLTDDVEVWTPFAPAGLGTNFKGIAEINERFGDSRRGMKFFSFYDVKVLGTEDPDCWVVTCRSEGDTPDGRHYTNTYCWMFWLRDGRIRKWTEYYDPKQVMNFLDNMK